VIDASFRLSFDGLVIVHSTQEEVESLGHPLDRPPPAAYEISRFSQFVVIRQANGAIVSSIVIERARDDPGTISVDWATDKAHQRKGYASKAARALIEWLHRQPGGERIEVDIVPGSEARDRTARRVGFIPTARPGRWVWQGSTWPIRKRVAPYASGGGCFSLKARRRSLSVLWVPRLRTFVLLASCQARGGCQRLIGHPV
jgi:hypothetical protein